MWIAATFVLVVLLVATFVLQQRRQRRVVDRMSAVLRQLGDEGLVPHSPEHALERLEFRLGREHVDPSPERMRAAIDQMSTGAVVVDGDGRVVLRNRVAAPFASARHGDALVEAVIQARLADALLGEHTFEELRLHGPPERVLLVVGNPLVVDDELIGAIALIDDVSEQDRLDAVRRDFVANVSHELRTPVGALSLLAETLEGEDDPEVIARFLSRIQDETARLARLIDDLLDLSRIEGGIGERVEEVEVAGLLSESLGAVRHVAEHLGVELVIEDSDVDATVHGDRAQLVSALTNLFENAVKYCDEGGSVTGRLAAHGSEVAIAVVDTGVGIPQRDVNRIFERFYRVDRGRTAASGGTGLGLSIVRHVAVNHGGRVEVMSQEGVGSTFTMILPALQTSANEREIV